MTDRSPGISAAGIGKSFGANVVLDGVDLEVAAGNITALLGPSGCGKTTLLRILAGFEDPDRGSVVVDGCPVAGPGVKAVPAHQRRVGLMPQEGALFPHLSVARNVTFGLPRRLRSDAGVAQRWLDTVDLGGFGAARPHELSGRQQQRVALARALAAEPSVLLLDEPFAALDAGLRARVREEIAGILRATQTTALLVTHDQTEALSLADSVVLLLNGRVSQHGPPDELYAFPQTLAAARFIGDTIELDGVVRAGVASTALGNLPVRSHVVGGDAVVVLRPEQVRLVEDPAAAAATVTARRFFGPDIAVHVELNDGTPLVIRRPSPETAGIGEVVRVAVDGTVLAYPSG